MFFRKILVHGTPLHAWYTTLIHMYIHCPYNVHIYIHTYIHTAVAQKIFGGEQTNGGQQAEPLGYCCCLFDQYSTHVYNIVIAYD